MNKELLQQALAALEESLDLVVKEHRAIDELYGIYPSRKAEIDALDRNVQLHKQAIIDLISAIAQPVQPALTMPNDERRTTLINCLRASKSWTTDYATVFVDDYFSAQTVQPATKLLTPSQIAVLIDDVIDTDDASLVLFARAVEAAHGITTPKETK